MAGFLQASVRLFLLILDIVILVLRDRFGSQVPAIFMAW
jgi:hypothetical protein